MRRMEAPKSFCKDWRLIRGRLTVNSGVTSPAGMAKNLVAALNSTPIEITVQILCRHNQTEAKPSKDDPPAPIAEGTGPTPLIDTNPIEHV